MAISTMIVVMIAPATMRSAPNLLMLFMIALRGSDSVSLILFIQDSTRPHPDTSIRYDHARRQVRKHSRRLTSAPDGSCRYALLVRLVGFVVPRSDDPRFDIAPAGQAHFDGLASLTTRHVYGCLRHIDLMRLRARRTSESYPHSTSLPEPNRLPYLVTRLCLKPQILSRSRGS